MYKPTADIDTVYREDGYEKSLTTGTVFVDLSAAYANVSHRVQPTKIYGMTEDTEFTKLIGCMMSNQRFYVELNGKKKQMAQSKEWFTSMECFLTRAIQCLYK